MRLRYLHLPNYGPLKDLRVVFQQNTHISGRKGAVNFIVGLNGSGKSTLLRAVYDVFHSLFREELPKFPVTLVYDIRLESHATVVFHRPPGRRATSFLTLAVPALQHETEDAWQACIDQLVEKREKGVLTHVVAGDSLKGDGNLRQWLPARVLTYTSGDPSLWRALTYPDFPRDELTENDADNSERRLERPCGWTEEQERSDSRVPLTESLAPSGSPGDGKKESDEASERCVVLSAEDVRFAAMTVGLWQAAIELWEHQDENAQAAFREQLLAQLDKKTQEKGARRLLNELDWLWPTHASFVFNSYSRNIPLPADAAAIFWLHALADTVLQLPLEESLSVISMGSRPPVQPQDLAGGKVEEGLRLVGDSMLGASSGAEALRCLLGDQQDPDKSLWLMFQRLRSWRESGLLKEILLTVKRIRQVPGTGQQPDDSVISYASFSDGEQMLLGRMALLLLLQKQDNSLLLLDEPETHFNDTWKRQIIDIIDDSILKETFSQVLVATHTSLALTDVFSCEIVRLDKQNGVISAHPVPYPTFGADPGRILLHVFGAPDVIGARAAEFLRSKLDPTKWPPENLDKLRALIDEIGSGWPRAKLMDILDQLEGRDAA